MEKIGIWVGAWRRIRVSIVIWALLNSQDMMIGRGGGRHEMGDLRREKMGCESGRKRSESDGFDVSSIDNAIQTGCD